MSVQLLVDGQSQQDSQGPARKEHNGRDYGGQCQVQRISRPGTGGHHWEGGVLGDLEGTRRTSPKTKGESESGPRRMTAMAVIRSPRLSQ